MKGREVSSAQTTEAAATATAVSALALSAAALWLGSLGASSCAPFVSFPPTLPVHMYWVPSSACSDKGSSEGNAVPFVPLALCPPDTLLGAVLCCAACLLPWCCNATVIPGRV